MAALAAAALIAPWSAEPAAAAPASSRIAGSDRYATAVEVSKAAFPSAIPTGTAVVVSGASFADALSAGPIAAKLGGPVLLTAHGGLPTSTRAELERLAPSRVLILGATGAVSKAVETQVRAVVADTRRIGGASRYETSQSAIRSVYTDGASHVYVATGASYADALAGGALAGAEGAPLLIVPGTAASLDPSAASLLSDLGASKVTIFGGVGAVSAATATALGDGRTVSRISGADRYATAAAVADHFPGTPRGVYVASGLNYPDALTATVLAARRGTPLLLNSAICANAVLRSHISSHGTTSMTLVGGYGVLRGLVATLEPCRSLTDPKSLWVMVNKKNKLTPTSYAPSGVRKVQVGGSYSMRSDAASALEKMSAASVAAGKGRLGLVSGYRSYSTQVSTYNMHVSNRGRAGADLVSARPGHSEHQTGLVGDVVSCASGCGSMDAFGGTAAGKWVKANAHTYGFIVRYEPGQTPITGYLSEPWHLRYVGVALATDYKKGGFHTLEEYLGYPAAPRY